MTPGEGTALVIGCVLLGIALRFVWKLIPVYQCPTCHSYDIDEFEIEQPEQHGKALLCKKCGRAWKDVEPE
jgi:hypothetical protein